MDTVWGGRVCALKGRTVAFLVNTDHHISSTKCPIQKYNHDFMGTKCTKMLINIYSILKASNSLHYSIEVPSTNQY